MSPRALLAQAVDVHKWLETDQVTAIAERALRDREIGRQQAQMDDVNRVLNWWAHVNPQPGHVSPGQRLTAMRRWFSVALFIAGAFSGIALCSIALAYDGDYPVNLLALLGVLVGIPGLLLLFTVLTGLFQGVGLRSLGEFVQTFNINRWVIGLWDRLCGEHFSAGFGQANARGTFAYWQLVTFSQVFGVGFFAGVLLIYGVLVAVTDLAFGWSTTLHIQAATVQSWVTVIAAPWATLLTSAAPDMGLIEASRFYRLAGNVGGGRAAQLGNWWPFVLMTILVWGLLPRLAMLVFSQWRLGAATRSLLREHSEVTALLDRLTTPALEHAGDVDVSTTQPTVTTPAARSIELADAAVIVWNEAYPQDLVNGQPGDVVALSSLNSTELRCQALRSLPAGIAKLVIYTKGWEPPVLEFHDLIALARAELGPGLSIVVAPVGVAGAAPSDSELAVWSRAIAGFGDPRVYVANASGGHG